MTIKQVATKLKINDYWVKKSLLKHGIEIRKKGFGFNVLPEVKFSEGQLDFFDGLIASDGSLVKRKNSNDNCFISCGFKHREFAEYIVDRLALKCKVKPYTHYSSRYKGGKCKQFKFLSSNNVFYTKQRSRWYPDGRKVIPEDFRFSPTSINIMFLCDGYIVKNKIFICMNSFNTDNLKILKNGFGNAGIKASIRKNSLLALSIYSTRDFFNYVGECPVNCYEYKWKVDENIISNLGSQ